ncbi:hypothetical protein BJ508DRAFT_308181 [Ascobolus immersus RN42]|uniref:Uncharacterized protein n=1 Tax=Ascobolus immersus RN42 TaxID=1160509 RepID=A0A3N4ID89_ASCIM|nr:hypothetical protein BJ508DRAFT_308181 [Ascobolus immersus RN42]
MVLSNRNNRRSSNNVDHNVARGSRQQRHRRRAQRQLHSRTSNRQPSALESAYRNGSTRARDRLDPTPYCNGNSEFSYGYECFVGNCPAFDLYFRDYIEAYTLVGRVVTGHLDGVQMRPLILSLWQVLNARSLEAYHEEALGRLQEYEARTFARRQ